MDLNDLGTGEKVALGGAVLTIIGSFLPWVSLGSLSVLGIDGDGVLTILFGLGVAGIVLVRDWSQIDQVGVGLLGILTVLVAGSILADLGGLASPGIGLYLTIVGGLVLVGAAIQGYREASSSGATAGGF